MARQAKASTNGHIPELTPEQQSEIATAHNVALQAEQAFKLADSQRAATVFRIMAQLGVSPDKYDPVIQGNQLTFTLKSTTSASSNDAS